MRHRLSYTRKLKDQTRLRRGETLANKSAHSLLRNYSFHNIHRENLSSGSKIISRKDTLTMPAYARLTAPSDPDIPRLLAAHQTPDITRWISIAGNFFAYVTARENLEGGLYYYKVADGGDLVGFLYCSAEDGTLDVSLAVFPPYRRRGIAAHILRDLSERRIDVPYHRLEAAVEEDNIPSRRLFEKAGFCPDRREEELIIYAKSVG